MKAAHTSLLSTAGAILFALVIHPSAASADPLPFPWAVSTQATSVSAGSSYCAKPRGLPHVRTAGSLVVESPPRTKPERWLRLRTHSSPPDVSGTSYWEGPEVPQFVPLGIGNMRLDLLDPIPGGYFAFYRSHGKNVGPNDTFEARLYSCSGQTLATVPLNPIFSRRDQLEVQDIRYADGTLYFNEACQTYSRQAGGRCSALVAVNPFTKGVLWRTGSLVSNSVMRVEAKHIIVGYGFTAESDWIRVVRRSDGRVVEKKALPSSHFGLEVQNNVLDVEVGGSWASFRMDGFDGPTPHLTSLGTHATRTATSSAPAAATAPAIAQPTALPVWTLPIQLTANSWFAPSTQQRGAPLSMPSLAAATQAAFVTLMAPVPSRR